MSIWTWCVTISMINPDADSIERARPVVAAKQERMVGRALHDRLQVIWRAQLRRQQHFVEIIRTTVLVQFSSRFHCARCKKGHNALPDAWG